MDESEINAVFSEIVRDIDVPHFDPQDSTAEYAIPAATEPITHVRDAIVGGLVDQLLVRGLDLDNPGNDPESTYAELTDCINKDFRQMDDINFGDTIVASGNTILILIDEAEEGRSYLPIPEGLRIVGKLKLLIVTEIPAPDALPRLRESAMNYMTDIDPLPTFRYGAVFVLEEPFAVDENGMTEPLPSHLTTLLPLNYPQLELRRQT